MNSLDFTWFKNWTGAVATNGLVVAAVLGVVLLLLLWWWWPRKPRGALEQPFDASARFAAMAPISDEQAALLRYLCRAFPDGAVLFRPRLSRFLTVRAGKDRSAARRWLEQAHVDYLLCNEAGTPLYAFEMDLLRTRGDATAQRRLADKNHALRSAGIRLIRFKGALATWPKPEVLRARVLAAVRPKPSGFGASGYAASGFAPAGIEPSGFAPSEFGASTLGDARHPTDAPSSVMSLTDLGGLVPGDSDNPWSDIKKRS